MTARQDVFAWNYTAMELGEVELVNGDPQLNENEHKFQVVNVLLVLVNGRLQVVLLNMLAHVRWETVLFEVNHGETSHVV
jgi:hypothetical protein